MLLTTTSDWSIAKSYTAIYICPRHGKVSVLPSTLFEKSFPFFYSIGLRCCVLLSNLLLLSSLLVLSFLRICLFKPLCPHPRLFLQLPLLLYQTPLHAPADGPRLSYIYQKGQRRRGRGRRRQHSTMYCSTVLKV
jgi:hypothetical protein